MVATQKERTAMRISDPLANTVCDERNIYESLLPLEGTHYGN